MDRQYICWMHMPAASASVKLGKSYPAKLIGQQMTLESLLQCSTNQASQNLWVLKPASKSSERLLLTGRVSESSCLRDMMKELHKLPWFLAGLSVPSRGKR